MFTLQRKIGTSTNVFRNIETSRFETLKTLDPKEPFSSYEDPSNPAKKNALAADGTQVGDTLQKIADKKEDEKEKDPKSEIPSPKEMQDAIAVSKANLKVAAEVDPSNLALQEHGPEKIKQAGLEVEKEGWPC